MPSFYSSAWVVVILGNQLKCFFMIIVMVYAYLWLLSKKWSNKKALLAWKSFDVVVERIHSSSIASFRFRPNIFSGGKYSRIKKLHESLFIKSNKFALFFVHCFLFRKHHQTNVQVLNGSFSSFFSIIVSDMTVWQLWHFISALEDEIFTHTILDKHMRIKLPKRDFNIFWRAHKK